MSQDQKSICLNCKWWNVDEYCSDIGECRTKSPERSGVEGSSDAAWPITNEEDWCGEFTARPLSEEARTFLEQIEAAEKEPASLALREVLTATAPWETSND